MLDGYELIEFQVDDDTYAFQIRCPFASQAQIIGISKILKDVLDAEFPEPEQNEDAMGFRSHVEPSDGITPPEVTIPLEETQMKKKLNYKSMKRSAIWVYFDLYEGDKFIKQYSSAEPQKEAQRLKDKGYISRDEYKASLALPPVEAKNEPSIFQEDDDKFTVVNTPVEDNTDAPALTQKEADTLKPSRKKK